MAIFGTYINRRRRFWSGVGCKWCFKQWKEREICWQPGKSLFYTIDINHLSFHWCSKLRFHLFYNFGPSFFTKVTLQCSLYFLFSGFNKFQLLWTKVQSMSKVSLLSKVKIFSKQMHVIVKKNFKMLWTQNSQKFELWFPHIFWSHWSNYVDIK